MIPPFPKTKSPEGLALFLMLQGENISHLGFLNLCGTYCLRTAVLGLRQADWPVDDVFKAGSKSIFSGRSKRFKCYFLNREQLQDYLENEKVLSFITAAKNHFEGWRYE